MSDILDQLFQESEDLSAEQIINELIRPENIELKTEIPNPAALVKLKLLGQWCRKEGLEDCGQLIDDWIEHYLKYMVSNKRQSRAEIINAIAMSAERKRSFRDRMFGGKEE